LDESDVEDDVDNEIHADNGWRCDATAVVAGDTQASVNTARVSVCLVTLCLTASHFQS